MPPDMVAEVEIGRAAPGSQAPRFQEAGECCSSNGVDRL